MLEVRIAAKNFVSPKAGAHPVLRDVAFGARCGEVLALFGASGTGKTTVLRAVLGLDHDFIGSICCSATRVGAMFQEPRLAPWLTIAENLRLVVTEGVPEPDIPALLREVGLAGAEHHRPGELSLGMARRPALARALVVEPQFLVLHEPFASLDPRLAAHLAGVVSRWTRGRGSAVLMATHDLDRALTLADRLLILAGRPATLAADVRVPDRASHAALRDELHGRFPFLRAGIDARA